MNRCYECVWCDDYTDRCENIISRYYEMDIDAISDCDDFEEIEDD